MAQDHFERHKHYDGVVDWNFNVLFTHQPTVAAMANTYRPFLLRPELYQPIPAQWLHTTILRIRTLDEYTEAEMRAVAQAVTANIKDLELPEFHLGDVKLIFGNICFPIEPASSLEILYDAVRKSLESVVGLKRTTKSPYGRFIAHLSLAYTKN